jgi:hypothetical protein
MRNMSFALTTAQMYARTKTVTRRLGWDDLKPGDRVMACEKCQGLGKGGTIKRIGVIECVSNRPVRLDTDTTPGECALEGFPGMEPMQFVRMFIEHTGCRFNTVVRRIEFKFVEVRHV